MKNLRNFCILITLLISPRLFSQDMIYKTDETSISAKVLEINATSVKYKLFNKTNETVFEIPKNSVRYIQYENGVKEFYNTSSKSVVVEVPHETPVEKGSNKKFLKNIIALNCFDMFFTNASFSYERIFNSGNISLKVPVSLGLQGKPNTQDYTSEFGQTQFLQNRNWAGGLELNIYPFGQTRQTFYLGLSGMVGSFNYFRDSTTYVMNAYNNYVPVIVHNKNTGAHYSGMVHLGGNIRLSDNFLFGTKLGIGFKREETNLQDYTLPTLQFDFNLGYRF